MTQADRIRQFAFDRYISRARARGCSEITVTAGDVHQGMGFKGLPRSTLSIAGEAGQKGRTGSTRKPAGGNSKSLCRGSTLYCNGCGL
jgi:hypothetical protein